MRNPWGEETSFEKNRIREQIEEKINARAICQSQNNNHLLKSNKLKRNNGVFHQSYKTEDERQPKRHEHPLSLSKKESFSRAAASRSLLWNQGPSHETGEIAKKDRRKKERETILRFSPIRQVKNDSFCSDLGREKDIDETISLVESRIQQLESFSRSQVAPKQRAYRPSSRENSYSSLYMKPQRASGTENSLEEAQKYKGIPFLWPNRECPL